MSQAPNLEVPQRERQPKSRGGASGFLIVLQLVLVVLVILSFFVSPGRSSKWTLSGGVSGGALPAPERQKALAAKLENMNLTEQAADAWETYLAMVDPEPFEAGNIRFRIGKLRQASEEYGAAIAQYYLAEELLHGSSDDLSHEIDLRVTECLRRLGQYADLAREVAARASETDGQAVLEGQQVVAEIGEEKVTLVDFDRLLTNEIELAVKSRLGLTPEEEDALRKRAHEQFGDPQMRAQQLHQIIASRVLADEARKQGLHESKEFRDRLVAVADGILASTLLFEEVNKRATVTDADVERFYAANADTYAEPPASFIAHILCRDEQHARDLIERINQGGSFDKMVKSESLDTTTREKLGILTAPVLEENDFVPGIGADAELRDRIRQAEAGKILDRPVESDRGWHVIKVLSHRERVERPLEEIKAEVQRDTLAARRREVTDQYMAELFDQAGVKLYPQVFLNQAEQSDKGETP